MYGGNNPLAFIDASGENPVAVVAILGYVAWEFFTDVNFAGDIAPTTADKLPWQAANVIGLPSKTVYSGGKSFIRFLIAKNSSKQLLLESGGRTVKHHIFNVFRGNSPKSQKYREFFAKHEIDINAYTIHIPENLHKTLHQAGNNWTTKWKQWIDANPNATTNEVYNQAGKMLEEYGVVNYIIQPY